MTTDLEEHTMAADLEDLRWALARLYVLAVQPWARPTVVWLTKTLDRLTPKENS